MDVEAAISNRHSVRRYADAPLCQCPIEKILAVGQRYPSAGNRRPLEIVAVTKDGPKRALAVAAKQEFVGKAAVVFVILADYKRTMQKYGERGARYAHMEAGHAAQNILLMATELGLGACPVGAFKDSAVAKILETELSPLYLIPVGMLEQQT